MQTEHSVLFSFWRSSSSTVRRLRAARPCSVAGGAPFDCGCASIRLVMIRSSASCVYTASPNTALPGLNKLRISAKLRVSGRGCDGSCWGLASPCGSMLLMMLLNNLYIVLACYKAFSAAEDLLFKRRRGPDRWTGPFWHSWWSGAFGNRRRCSRCREYGHRRTTAVAGS